MLSSCSGFLWHSFVLVGYLSAAHAQAQDTSPARRDAAVPSATYRADMSFSAMHLTSVDETLSPERFGGAGGSVFGRVVREAGRRRVSLQGAFGATSSLTTARSSGGLPRMRFVAVDGRVDVQQRLRARFNGGTTVFVGAALDGRYAERTHHLDTPAGASPAALSNSGRDYVVALQPTIEFARPLGSSAIADRLGVAALAAVRHEWAPSGSFDAAVKLQAPPSLVQIDNLLALTRAVGRHGTIGVSYRLRLFRARSPILLAESRHDLALSLGWRRGGAP